MMKVLIFGASGATGHELVRQALEQGFQVTAFVRNPKNLRIRHSNLTIAPGNVIDYATVKNAMRGQDAVLCALGAASPFAYDASLATGIRNIILNMEIAAVHRLVYLSFAGVTESRPHAGFIIRHVAPRILSAEITGHEEREKLIKQSTLQWVIVRSPTLTNGRHRAKLRYGENIRAIGFPVTISRASVAGFMIRQLNDHSFTRRKPMVMNG